MECGQNMVLLEQGFKELVSSSSGAEGKQQSTTAPGSS